MCFLGCYDSDELSQSGWALAQSKLVSAVVTDWKLEMAPASIFFAFPHNLVLCGCMFYGKK